MEPGPFCGLFGAPPTSAVRADVRYLRPCRTDLVLPALDQSHGSLALYEQVPVLAVASVPSRTPLRDGLCLRGASTWLLTWPGTQELRNSVVTLTAGALLVCSSPATRSGRWVSPSPARALHDRAGRGPSSPAAWSTSAESPSSPHHQDAPTRPDFAELTAPATHTAGYLCGSTSAGSTTHGLMARVRSGCPCGAPGRERPTPDHPETGHAPTAGTLPIRVPRRDVRDLFQDRPTARTADEAGPGGAGRAGPGRFGDLWTGTDRPDPPGPASGRRRSRRPALGTITDNSSRGVA